MYDVCVIGHVTRDVIKTKDVEKEMPGGTAYYSPMTLKSLDSNVCLVTKLAKRDRGLLRGLIEKDIEVFCGESEETTTFENIYPGDLSPRTQNVKHIAEPFTTEEIQGISAKIFHLGPLTKEDIPLEILRTLARKSRISLDVQGFLRRVDRGVVKNIDWQDKDEGLTYISILKASEPEAMILSEEKDIERAAVKLSQYGIDEVIITLGNKGSLIHSKGELHRVAAVTPNKAVDPTGCGDAYVAGYIHKRLRSCNIDRAAKFATAVASLTLEGFGPFKGNEQKVQALLQLSSSEENIAARR